MALTAVFLVPSLAVADTTDRAGRVGQIVEAAQVKLLQQRGATEIDRRLASIDQMTSRVDEADAMTDAHKSGLRSQLEADKTQLADLKNKLAAETDETAVRADVQSIFGKFRVYALLVPKVHIVRSADAVDAAAGELENAAAQLDTVVARQKASGRNTADIEASLVTAHESAKTAKDVVKGVGDATMSLDPQNYPANVSQRDAALQAVQKAGIKLRQGLEALRQAIVELRARSAQ